MPWVICSINCNVEDYWAGNIKYIWTVPQSNKFVAGTADPELAQFNLNMYERQAGPSIPDFVTELAHCNLNMYDRQAG